MLFRSSVAFAAGTVPGSTYTITSSPGSYYNTGSSSPIVVTGLQSNTAYTFTATASNVYGTSSASSASSAITATTVPQAPSISAVAGNQQATITITPGATGGSSITQYSITSKPATTTQTTTNPTHTCTGLTNGTAYTFTVTATNANGTSAASSASNSVIPALPYTGESVSGGSGYTNMTTVWADNTSSLSTNGTPSWTCSNQGT